MRNPSQPPLQSQIDHIWGSPEGVEYGEPGRLIANQRDGKVYKKTTPVDENTGWIEWGGGGAALMGIYAPDNYAEAKLIPLDPTPFMAVVQGEFTPGDGGGGMFIWDATSTLPDDFWAAIALTANGADPGRFVRRPLI